MAGDDDRLDRLEGKIDKVADVVAGLRDAIATQAVNCARVCGAQQELNKALAARVDDLEGGLGEERKRVNGLATGNAFFAAIASLLAAVFGR